MAGGKGWFWQAAKAGFGRRQRLVFGRRLRLVLAGGKGGLWRRQRLALAGDNLWLKACVGQASALCMEQRRKALASGARWPFLR